MTTQPQVHNTKTYTLKKANKSKLRHELAQGQTGEITQFILILIFTKTMLFVLICRGGGVRGQLKITLALM